jgi:hypothetical protein
MALATQPTASPHRTSVADASPSYVDWPAIIAGAILASALSLILLTFGSAVGLSMVSPEPGEGVSLRWVTIAAGIWFVWVAVSSFGAGGYLAGRLRRRIGDAPADEVETRDGAHGVLVWATGALVGAVLAAFGVGGLLGGAASTAGSLAGPAAEVVERETDYYSGLILRGDAEGASPEARAEVAAILGRGLARGEIAQADREYLGRLAAAETGSDPAAAQARVDAVLAEAEAARATAIEAVEQARVAGVIGAFILAATMMLSAAAAYFAAVAGGDHRDRGLAFSRFGR